MVTSDIISPFLTNINNDAKLHSDFPNSLKLADITPIHKREETTVTDNYRSVSILPSVSKIFERDMEKQISSYMEKFLSPFMWFQERFWHTTLPNGHVGVFQKGTGSR